MGGSPGTRVGVLAAAAVAALAIAVPAALAAPTLHGTFATPTVQGSITYKAVRGILHGSEGTFVVAGKRYPGSVYSAVGGGTGMVWYYGTSGIMAGNALVTLQPDGTYVGPIWFFDRRGQTTDAGSVTVTFP